jgi:hypothetical protein
MKFGLAAASATGGIPGSTGTTGGDTGGTTTGDGTSGSGGSTGSSGTTGSAAISATMDSSSYTIGAGQGVTFTAAFMGNSGTPGGTVTFQDGSNAISGCASVAIASGKAKCTTSALAGGTHSISGKYSGDSTYGPALAGPINQTVSGTTSSSGTSTAGDTGTPAIPAAPASVSPAGTVATTTPTYTWNASSGASSYYLVAQNTSGAAVSMSVSASAAGCASGGTCSVTPSTPLANGVAYNWFVNASSTAGTSAWSAGKSIMVSGAGPSAPAAPTLVAPSGTVTTASPAYTWNASAGATQYYLVVQNTAGVAVASVFPASSAGCSSGSGTCSVTPSKALANGATYNWFVMAINSVGSSGWSAGKTITVSASGPTPPAAPVQLAPSGTVTTSTPAYTWNASPGASSYYLIVMNTSGVAVGSWYTAAELGCGSGTCTATPSKGLANGTSYNWFVMAANDLGTSAWSAGMTISVSASGPSVPMAPTLLAPSGNATSLRPAFTWNASPGATSYYFLVQNTRGVAIGLWVSAATAGCTAGSGTCTYTPSASLVSSTTYSWFVAAANSLGTSAWSAGKTIRTP